MLEFRGMVENSEGRSRNVAERIRVSSGTVWEGRVGYSRAVRAGNLVFVSGTTATDDQGNVVGRGDPEAQARFILEKIERALEAAGASLSDVVRTRVYVTNADDWEAVGRAHAAYFGEIRPANTLVEVSRLVGPDYLVEIEADAVIGSGGAGA
jgi:enamine deaminase RidA (YjgF/YER057c/UK114 family)